MFTWVAINIIDNTVMEGNTSWIIIFILVTSLIQVGKYIDFCILFKYYRKIVPISQDCEVKQIVL